MSLQRFRKSSRVRTKRQSVVPPNTGSAVRADARAGRYAYIVLDVTSARRPWRRPICHQVIPRCSVTFTTESAIVLVVLVGLVIGLLLHILGLIHPCRRRLGRRSRGRSRAARLVGRAQPCSSRCGRRRDCAPGDCRCTRPRRIPHRRDRVAHARRRQRSRGIRQCPRAPRTATPRRARAPSRTLPPRLRSSKRSPSKNSCQETSSSSEPVRSSPRTGPDVRSRGGRHRHFGPHRRAAPGNGATRW